MEKLENYTIKELIERLDNNTLSVEEMIFNYLDEKGESDLIILNLDVEKRFGSGFKFTAYEDLQELEDYLLYEDDGFLEEKNAIKYDLALSVLNAYTKDNTESDLFGEDGSEYETFDDIIDTLNDKIYFEISFENTTEQFKKHFYSNNME